MGNAVTSALQMRGPDTVPATSAFRGQADLREHRLRDDLAQVTDKVEDLREHRLRDNLAQVTDKGTGAGGSRPWNKG